MDTSLASFGAGEAEPTAGLVGVANAAYLTDPPERENIAGWLSPSTEYGLTTHQVAVNGTGGLSQKAAKHEVRWVSGGDLAGYVEEYGDELRRIPGTYSGFNGGEFDTYLSCVDGLVEDYYGYGISGTAAERALRVLNDNGRYKQSKYHLITAGEHPWVLTGPKGTVLCSPVPVERTPANSRQVPVEFSQETVQIEEENPIVLRALKRVEAYLTGQRPAGAPEGIAIEIDTTAPLAFAEHEKPPTSTKYGGTDQHVFSASGNDEAVKIKIQREDFRNLGMMALRSEELPGVGKPATIESPSGTQVTFEYSPERDIGEYHPEGLVIGHSFDWETYPYSPEEVAIVTTYHMEMPSESVGKLFTVDINRTETRVATTSAHY
jgi:hypothetical protein